MTIQINIKEKGSRVWVLSNKRKPTEAIVEDVKINFNSNTVDVFYTIKELNSVSPGEIYNQEEVHSSKEDLKNYIIELFNE